MIRYYLLRNNLVDDPEAYMAKVRPSRTIDLEYLIEEICLRETTVGESDVRSVLTLYFKVIERMLQNGTNVITPLVQYRAGIKGVFHRASDGFDPSRHRLVARLIPGKRLRRLLRDCIVVKEDPTIATPYLREYFDVGSGLFDSTLTPGSMGQVLGRNLRFDAADPAQGVFFVASDESATRAEEVGKNLPAELFFLVPALAPGDYTLEVRAAVNGSEEISVGKLLATLTVS
jgi:hypothetical protein